MNISAQEFDLAYYDVTDQHFNHFVPKHLSTLTYRDLSLHKQMAERTRILF